MQGVSGLLDFIVPLFVFIIATFCDSESKSIFLGIIILLIMGVVKIISGLVIAHTKIQNVKFLWACFHF